MQHHAVDQSQRVHFGLALSQSKNRIDGKQHHLRIKKSLELTSQFKAKHKKNISNPVTRRTRRSLSQAAQLTCTNKKRVIKKKHTSPAKKKKGRSSKRRAHQALHRKEAHLIASKRSALDPCYKTRSKCTALLAVNHCYCHCCH